jgi:hypothetical protein
MCLAVWLVYINLGRLSLGIDDAHIFFVYGRNVAVGEGMVYNLGAERVEGYSSVLWMLIVVAAFLFSSNPEASLLVVSLLLVTGAITALWYFVEEKISGRLLGLLLLAWIFSSPSYVFWMSLPLMDTALWSSLLILGTIVAVSANSPGRLALLVALTLLTRPEGMLWGLVFIGVAGLVVALRQGREATWIEVRLAVVTYSVVLGGLLLFRVLYFGYPLPNTYYAKMSPDMLYNLRTGIEYLLLFTYLSPAVWLGIVCLVAAMLLNVPHTLVALNQAKTGTDTAQTQFVAISLIALAGLLVPVLMGGDHMFLFRFYQPIWPLLILPVFGLTKVLDLNVGPVARYGLAAAAIGIFFFSPWATWSNQRYRYTTEFEVAVAGEATGAVLNDMFEDDLPSIGVITAGGIALEYEGKVIDVMGLNNVAMAHALGDRRGYKGHAAFNAEVFFEQRPNIFLPEIETKKAAEIKWNEKYRWDNQVLKGLLEDQTFLTMYQLVLLSKVDAHVLAYVERSYLNTLLQRDIELDVIGKENALH